MSKLHVEVTRINNIQQIIGADRIVLATVKGWNVIIGKDQFKENDLCIFIPPDAVLPDELIEREKLSYLKGANRIRTVKLKGTISQGLVLQLSVLQGYTVREGDDVAEVLGIIKYEPPVMIHGNYTPKSVSIQINELWEGVKVGKVTYRRAISKTFGLIISLFKRKKKVNPDFDVYTDIDNVKHYPQVFDEGEDCVITEKIHGTNFRAGTLQIPDSFIGKIIKKITGSQYEFVYGSHRVQKTTLSGKGFYGEDVYGQIAKRYNLKEVIPQDYILYGEIYGPKIQELTYGATQLEVVFFDIKYKDKYLNYEEFNRFCFDRKLPRVPVLYQGCFRSEQLKYFTEGMSILNLRYKDNTIVSPNIREGCVVKPLVEVNHPHLGRKILKSISAEYLLTKKQENPEEVVDDNSEYAH